MHDFENRMARNHLGFRDRALSERQSSLKNGGLGQCPEDEQFCLCDDQPAPGPAAVYHSSSVAT